MEQEHGAGVQQEVNSEILHESRLTSLPPALILEILKHLGPRDLSIAACICPLFRLLVSDSHGWKDFYCERWGMPTPVTQQPQTSEWKALYVAKESSSKSLLGKFTTDRLCGHTASVRAVRMLASAKLVASAGFDSTVRLWDLEQGIPVAWSEPVLDNIRALAVDHQVLALGCTSGSIRLFHGDHTCPYFFDLFGTSAGRKTVFRAHTGPVTSLGLDTRCMYSGSWDMSVRIWERERLCMIRSFYHWDWIWALVPRGGRVLSTAGSDAYSWDVESGELLRMRVKAHEGRACAVEGSRTGQFVMTGGEDGAVRMFDDRVAPSSSPEAADSAVAAWLPHSSAVTCLAFDDPWLASASQDGTIALMDLRYVIRKGYGRASSLGNPRYAMVNGDTVQRMLSSGGGGVYAVDIGSDRVVCGGDDTMVRVWDFSQALEVHKKADALRNLKKVQRLQRKGLTN